MISSTWVMNNLMQFTINYVVSFALLNHSSNHLFKAYNWLNNEGLNGGQICWPTQMAVKGTGGKHFWI